ncbi:MAG TPA: MaoC family dehydratase N-terminal domain-containing protein [Baekduia sp.]|nr:MaoC family dehydratase N-terminal domain-containing protein [Baekduia sp.]
MSEEIPEAVRALIGVTKTREVQVTLRDIKRFAQAIGETNPLHYDEDFARTTRHGRVVAPPLFCQALTYDDLPPAQLGADGAPTEIDLDIPAQRAVGGSSDYRIDRLVAAGETITVISQLQDIYIKQGRSGPLYMIVVKTDFIDQQGDSVASETATYIKRI